MVDEPMVFRAKWWKRLDTVGLTILFSSLLVANTWLIVSVGATAASLFLMPWWIALVSGVVFSLLAETIEVEFLQGSVVFRSLLRKRALKDIEIQMVEDKVAGEDSYLEVYAASGESFGLPVKEFDHSEQLARLLKSRCSEAHSDLINSALDDERVFGAGRLAGCTFFVAFLVAISGGIVFVVDSSDPVRYVGIAFAVFGAAISLLALAMRKVGVTVNHEGIRFKQLVGARSIRWSDLTCVMLSSPRIQGARHEWIELRSEQTTINLMDMRDDFALLREVVLTKAPPGVVLDERHR